MSEKLPPSGRIAGIDYGTVRIGIAVSDPERKFASAYENYTRRSLDKDARYFRELVNQERIVGFVVGLPVHMSGDESEKSREARRFGSWLAEQTECPVVYFDERYTSALADEVLRQAQVKRGRRRERRDMLAAQILLTAFLESPDVARPPEALED